jgi:glycosyltransferase involved in cell wall biosynthesis
MNLGIIMYRGGSLKNLRSVGQEKRFIDYYLRPYSRCFDKVYLFSYDNEKADYLPENCHLISNKKNIPSPLYSFAMPPINRKDFRDCDVFRVFHPSATVPALIGKALYGKKYVTTYGYMWIDFLKLRKRYVHAAVAKAVEFFGLKFSDSVMVTVKETHDYARRYVCKERIVRIPNGVDVNQFRPERKARHGKRKRLVFVGRLGPQKNLHNLIKAVSMLNGAELRIIGDGPLRKELEGLASETRARVDFAGTVPHEKLPEEFNKSDVFVFPTLIEGHPKALTEAMSSGIPCIGSRVRGIKEILNDQTGIMCETDPESIVAAIKWTLENPEEAGKRATRARDYVINNFSIDKLMEREIGVLKSL